MSEKDIGVEIQDASDSDRGKGIARLDTDSMKRLGIPSGGIIEIQGQRKTYAKCLQSQKTNPALGVLDIDGLIRSNGGIDIGSMIYIKRMPVTKARRIVLAPLEITSFVEVSQIRDALISFPVIQDNNVAFENLGEHVFFRILETIPPNRPLITASDTEIQVKDYYFLESDKKSDENDDDQEGLEIKITDEEFTEEEFLRIKASFEM